MEIKSTRTKKIFSVIVWGLLSVTFLGLKIQTVFAHTYTYGSTGSHPYSLTIDTNGNVYTANYYSGNVSKITPEGVSTILGTTGDNPFAIVIDGNGNIYTANNNGTDNVTKITPEGVSTILGTTGSSPSGIAIDAVGNIYTANNGSNNVSKITPEGVSTILGTTGSNPEGIILDAVGNVYTSNVYSDNVSKITPEGVSTILGTTGSHPVAIVMDGIGNVYTSNNGSNNVSKITPEGVSTILGLTNERPEGITIDGNGNIYTANFYSNVTRITPEGVTTNVGATGYVPSGIIMDEAGNVYTTNYGASNITKFNNPTISEITAVSTPVTVGNALTYTFNTNSAGTINYGESLCVSSTTTATLGDNTITFNSLPVGTYGNCTITLTDIFGTSNVLPVSSFTVISITHTLSYTAGANGTITGTTSQTVEDGANGTEVTAVPNTGYHFSSWSDEVTTASRTDTNAIADITVTANFAADSHPSGGGGGGGRITKPKILPTPTICNFGEKFNTQTGLPCTTFTTNPISNQNPNTICTLTQTLRQGNTGEQVKCLQIKLNILSDGIFGPMTKAVVMSFQQLHNLVPDGIVGPKTRGELK